MTTSILLKNLANFVFFPWKFDNPNCNNKQGIRGFTQYLIHCYQYICVSYNQFSIVLRRLKISRLICFILILGRPCTANALEGLPYFFQYLVLFDPIFIMIFPLLVSWTIAVVLSVLGFLTILAVILCICYCLKNKNKKKQHAFGIKKNYFKVFPKYIPDHRSLFLSCLI